MSNTKEATVMEVQRGIIQPHHPGQDVLPEEITGNPPRRSHLRFTWLSASVSPRRPDRSRSG
jgi:hypothetical protein